MALMTQPGRTIELNRGLPPPHVVINVLLLWVFARTLARGREPLITGFARRVHGELPPEIVDYTRRVTWAWCIFFLTMATASLLLFSFASQASWSLFANLLYLPMLALMFLAEYAYRIVRYRHFRHASLLSGMRFAAELEARP